MQFRFGCALAIAAVLGAAGCRDAKGDKPEATAKPDKTEKVQDDAGSMHVHYNEEDVTFKVGAAYATPQKAQGGSFYSFLLFNDKAKPTQCGAKLGVGGPPVGGNNWAVQMDMAHEGAPVKTGDKARDFALHAAEISFVESQGAKPEHLQRSVYFEKKEAKLTVVSIDGAKMRVRIEGTGSGGSTYPLTLKGEFTAQICPAAS